MIVGRGFIAVALVIFASWEPIRVLGGAYLFGAALALSPGAAGAWLRHQPVRARRRSRSSSPSRCSRSWADARSSPHPTSCKRVFENAQPPSGRIRDPHHPPHLDPPTTHAAVVSQATASTSHTLVRPCPARPTLGGTPCATAHASRPCSRRSPSPRCGLTACASPSDSSESSAPAGSTSESGAAAATPRAPGAPRSASSSSARRTTSATTRPSTRAARSSRRSSRTSRSSPPRTCPRTTTPPVSWNR